MKTIVAGALGECVHVAGVYNFLRLAELAGWRTVFLGPAVPVQDFLRAAEQEKADLVGVSYRLTPETGERLLGEFAEAADELRQAGVRFVFGGTPPVSRRAEAMQGFFEAVFDGSQPPEEILAFLRGENSWQAMHRLTRRRSSRAFSGNIPTRSCGITSACRPWMPPSRASARSQTPKCWT
jgi:methylmalonyl-CoA mutase cobalamin-binding subunit